MSKTDFAIERKITVQLHALQQIPAFRVGE
jgi:hypothetical protein